MSAVYSHRFHLHTGTGPWSWICPTGRTAVVKMVTAYNGAVEAGNAYLQLNGTTIWLVPLPGASAQLHPGLHLVVNSGEDLTAGTANPSTRMSVHGYLLTNTPAAIAELEAIERGIAALGPPSWPAPWAE
jgi:hypothetical protein